MTWSRRARCCASYRSALALLGVLLAVAAAVPGPARAQTGTQDEDALRQAARDRYLHGKDLLGQGNAVAALQEFAASYQLYASWASLYGMAMCQEALGRPAEALELYQQVLREGGTDVPDTERTNIADRIATLQARIGATPPTATTGQLVVRSTPAGAAIRIDGQDAGSAPMQLDVTVGPHRVEAQLEGYESATRWVDVVEGQQAGVDFALTVGGPAQPGGQGALRVSSDPPGRVSVDGVEVGATPTGDLPVAAGTRRVRVVDDTGRAWEQDVEIVAGGTMVVDVRLGVAAGLDPLWFWLTAGTAGALAVGGAATGGYVLSLKDEYDDPATSPSRRDEIKSSGDPLRVVTDALFGAAGACAVGALTLLFFTDFSGEGGSEADVRPLAGDGTGVARGAATQW